MKNIRVFLTENFQFLELKFSIHLYRHVLVMCFQQGYNREALRGNSSEYQQGMVLNTPFIWTYSLFDTTWKDGFFFCLALYSKWKKNKKKLTHHIFVEAICLFFSDLCFSNIYPKNNTNDQKLALPMQFL